MAIDKLQTDALSNTVTANIASVAIGANVSINSSTFVVGSGQIKATGITLPSNFGVSSNTTNLLENRNGQLFFNGRRVDLVNEYVAVYGYITGGNISTGYTTATDILTFATGAVASSSLNLSIARGFMCGITDASVYGYVLGGTTGAVFSTADRLTFSTQTLAAAAGSNLTTARGYASGVSDGAVYGYVVGGSTGAIVATAERLTFSTGVMASSTISNLSSARADETGVSDGAVYGYTLGGAAAAATAAADRLTFSTSASAASTVSNLSQARFYAGYTGISDGSIYGYVTGGYTTAPVATSDRLTFSTSVTAASTASNLSQARYDPACTSDGSTYGYTSGGYTSGYQVTTDRLTFSTSVMAARTASNLSVGRYAAASCSDYAV